MPSLIPITHCPLLTQADDWEPFDLIMGRVLAILESHTAAILAILALPLADRVSDTVRDHMTVLGFGCRVLVNRIAHADNPRPPLDPHMLGVVAQVGTVFNLCLQVDENA